MKENSISVVIPVYNGEKSIEKCVQSVLNQTKFNLICEILIINDGSTDNTFYIIENLVHLSNKIKIVHQENKGVSKARNYGIRIAKGEWIAFLDSDDIWFTNKIEKQAKVIDEFCPDMVSGNIRDTKQKVGFVKSKLLTKVSVTDMLIRSFPQTSTVVVKRKVLSNYMFNEDQSYAEDINLFIKICSQFIYYHLNEQVVIYDNNKNQFGIHNGLSSNIRAMNIGVRRNLKEFYEMGIINFPLYFLFTLFNEIKYIRRIMKSIYARKFLKGVN